MSAMLVGLLGVILLLVIAFIGVPISLAMALSGFIGFYYLSSSTAALSVMAIDVFSNFTSYSLTTIPMFVLMGCIAYNSGISKSYLMRLTQRSDKDAEDCVSPLLWAVPVLRLSVVQQQLPLQAWVKLRFRR
jgi:TRAP-type mannitol/chloroaromatic compound transport system permease large subunit